MFGLQKNNLRKCIKMRNVIWFKRLSNIDQLTGKDLLMHIAQGKLPSFESISRCRRKIQQEDRSLRGELWDKRHQIANDIRKEIRTFHLKLERNNNES